MKIDLEGELPVERFAVPAELAFLERRPELGILCRAARAAGGRITEERIAEILPGLGKGGVRNILAGCRHLGLCDDAHALTPLGLGAAESDEVPVPEQGVYDLWVADHPLLGRRILHAERLGPQRGDPVLPADALPIVPERERLFTSVLEPTLRLVLRDFPHDRAQLRCKRWPAPAPLALRWTWDMDAGQDRWELRGHLDAGTRRPPVEVRHGGESAGVDVWALFAELAGDCLAAGTWDRQQRRLAVSDAGLTAGEQDSFCKRWDLAGAELRRHGSFQRARLDAVPIGPATAADAARWARARFDRRLDGGTQALAYQTRASVVGQWAGIVRDTPLAAFAPPVPAHEDLLRAAARPALFWSLAAPVDLAPVEVEAAALGRVPVTAGELA
jgi:hypothetical protein